MQPKISVITPSIRPLGLKIVQDSLERQTFREFEWLTELGFESKSNLNTALNKMARRAKGELLVFYQDWIAIPDDGLAKFWEAYQQKKAFYTAAVNSDWRTDKANHNRPMPFTHWEIDWGACPRDALVAIGGFDEELDRYWGFDNVNAGLRAEMAGYEIICIDNPATAQPHPEAILKKNRNPAFHNERLDAIRRGLRINHL